jgi:hypothetical protein
MNIRSSSWRVPIVLAALGVVPVVIAGAVRLVDLSGVATMPPDTRYTASPWPVVVHIVSATVFAMLASSPAPWASTGRSSDTQR